MSKILKITAIIMTAACLTAGTVGCADSHKPEIDSESLSQSEEINIGMVYTEYLKQLDVDLSSVVFAEEGETIVSEGEGDYSYFCFTLNEGKEAEAKTLLNEKFGYMRSVDPNKIPAFMGHPIAEKMKTENIIGVWKGAAEGSNGAKTRILTFYMTELNGSYCIYFFG